MARFARVIALGVPHHITQRGNARRFILDRDADRRVYLDLLRQSAERSEIELIGYCLMSNHVHLIAIPNKANVLGLALKDAHGRYASYWNAMRCSSGHVWQGRYYSCPLDESHLWEALRYTELNPVRASMVAKAEGWGWSSAAAHCGSASAESWLGMELWRKRWSAASWREYLEAGESPGRAGWDSSQHAHGQAARVDGVLARSGRADKAAPRFAKAWTQASGGGKESGNVFVWGLVERVRVRV
jgi:putative transposase